MGALIAAAVAAPRFRLPQNPAGRKIAAILVRQDRQIIIAASRSARTHSSSFQKTQGKPKPRVAPPRHEEPASARTVSGNVHVRVSGILCSASPKRSFDLTYTVQQLPHRFRGANSSLGSYTAPARSLDAAHLTQLRARRPLKNLSPGDEGECGKRPGDPRSKAHPEPPLDSLVVGNASRTLHRRAAEGRITPTLCRVRLCRLAEQITRPRSITRLPTCSRRRAHGVFQRPARRCLRGFKSPDSHGRLHVRANALLSQETCRHLHRDLQGLPVTPMRPGASKRPAHREQKRAPKEVSTRLLRLESSSTGEVALGEQK